MKFWGDYKPRKWHYANGDKAMCGAKRGEPKLTDDPRLVTCARCLKWLSSESRQTSLF